LNKKSRTNKDITGDKTSEIEKPFSDLLNTGIQVAGIAHDLNNILATISGYAEIIREDLTDDSPLKENASRIMAAVVRARSITDRMLGSGSQADHKRIQVNVNEILIETIDHIRPALPDYIKVKSDISEQRANVFADPTQLFRVFLNLITNAVQSMENSGGTLYASLSLLDSSKVKSLIRRDITADSYAVVTFKDTGLGMNASVMQKIFDPFFTTREADNGTGLGLSVVHEIVAGMKGEIIVSSKENEGSVFDLYLPVFKEITP